MLQFLMFHATDSVILIYVALISCFQYNNFYFKVFQYSITCQSGFNFRKFKYPFSRRRISKGVNNITHRMHCVDTWRRCIQKSDYMIACLKIIISHFLLTLSALTRD